MNERAAALWVFWGTTVGTGFVNWLGEDKCPVFMMTRSREEARTAPGTFWTEKGWSPQSNLLPPSPVQMSHEGLEAGDIGRCHLRCLRVTGKQGWVAGAWSWLKRHGWLLAWLT